MQSRTNSALAILACLIVILPLSGNAQQINGCTRSQLDNPQRVVFQCGDGLVLEAEAAAALDIQEQPGEPRPETVELDSEALLVDVEPGSGPFQILTPQAIAAVRGTQFIVDVQPQMTAVFVTRGQVQVSRLNGQEAVSLTEGEGVEVSDDQPLEVKTWPVAKAARLLARFGR
ncbi:FecR domain-containing protein [Rhodobacterales bacterium]|nr:FecR domain-containing protein [Rhodobacterales bacterium]